MTPTQLESLKAHFQEWSGGFLPESPHEVVVYVDYARDVNIDRNEALEALTDWMEVEDEGD